MNLTHHAAIRAQQRGIPASPFLLEILERFARRRATADGAERLFLDHAARRAMQGYLGRRVYARLESFLSDAFVVAKHGEALTIGHRTRRIRRRT